MSADETTTEANRVSKASKASEEGNRLVTAGLRHVALNVAELEACLTFYTDLLGMQIEWQPDADNVFLCSGSDNLALHRLPPGQLPPDSAATGADGALAPSVAPPTAPSTKPRLDHIGFIIDNIADIDRWHEQLVSAGVTIAQAPKTHRDGARSFYCYDPDGTLVQLIYHPPISQPD